MTEKRDISRRSALKGIAGAGALLGGLGLAGSASAHKPSEYARGQIEDVSFSGCDAVEITFEKYTKFPLEGIQFTFYSKDMGSVVTMTPTIRYEETTELDGKHGSKGRRFTFAGGANPEHDRILAVSAGSDTYENPNSCKNDHDDGIDLEGVCYKTEKNRAKFRVSNGHRKGLKLAWKELDGKQSGTLTVPKKGSATFWVALDGTGETKVALYHDDEKVAAAKADTDDHCKKGH